MSAADDERRAALELSEAVEAVAAVTALYAPHQPDSSDSEQDSDLATALSFSTLSSASESESWAADEQAAVDQAIAAVSASYSVDHTN